MKLIIIPVDTTISIDGESIEGCDVSWIPEFTGDYSGVPQKVHALQWYDDHGEIELVTNDSNIKITELGIFEQAIAKYTERKLVIEAEAEAAAEAAIRTSFTTSDFDIDQLLAELESESNNENVGIAST
jgi:hypothetical protein